MENNNTKLFRVQVVKPAKISDNTIVKLTRQGRRFAVEVFTIPSGSPIRRLGGNRYMRLKTGEVLEFKKSEETKKGVLAIKKSMERLKGIIRANFGEESHKELHITLTYAENMCDVDRLMFDFKNFVKRLKYELDKHKLEYVAVAEPQRRGAWHMHVLLKTTNQPKLYIENDLMQKIWGHGFTKTKKIKVDDVGTYFMAYFCDLYTENGRKKGQRFHYYPKGMKFYRCSRGIVRPKAVEAVHGEVVKEYGTPVYESAVEVIGVEAGDVFRFSQKNEYKKNSNQRDGEGAG